MKKHVVLFITFCFALNMMIPFSGISSDTLSEVCLAAKNQSETIGPMALINFQAKVVYNLVAKYAGLGGSLSDPKNESDKNSKHTQNQPANTLMLSNTPIGESISAITNTSLLRSALQIFYTTDTEMLQFGTNILFAQTGVVFMCLILLFFLIILPRGTINDSIIIINNIVRNAHPENTRVGFFYLKEANKMFKKVSLAASLILITSIIGSVAGKAQAYSRTGAASAGPNTYRGYQRTVKPNRNVDLTSFLLKQKAQSSIEKTESENTETSQSSETNETSATLELNDQGQVVVSTPYTYKDSIKNLRELANTLAKISKNTDNDELVSKMAAGVLKEFAPVKQEKTKMLWWNPLTWINRSKPAVDTQRASGLVVQINSATLLTSIKAELEAGGITSQEKVLIEMIDKKIQLLTGTAKSAANEAKAADNSGVEDVSAEEGLSSELKTALTYSFDFESKVIVSKFSLMSFYKKIQELVERINNAELPILTKIK